MIIGEYQLPRKDSIRQDRFIQALMASLIFLLICLPAHAWVVPVAADDDPANPKKLRTDVPVTVKIYHFTDVVDYVDSERSVNECNLGVYVWPPVLAAELVAGGVVTITHINEIRRAVRQMYVDKYGVGWSCATQFPPGTSGATLCEDAAVGDLIGQDHINDLRHSFGANFDTANVCDLFPDASLCSGNIFWTDQGCGGGVPACDPTDQYQTGYDPVNPANVACHTNRCFPSGTCGGVLTCGNGVFDGGEGCDDGNTSDGDGCGATCSCEITFVPMGCGLGGCAAGEMYKVGTTYTVATAECPSPTDLCYTEAACGGALCGNSVPEAGEQCDDSNIIDGDGCNSTCQCEYTWVDETCAGPTDNECLVTEMYQTGTSLSAQCAATTQCVVSAACDGGCGGCTAWSSEACGAYGYCPINQMKQIRNCGGVPGCQEWQCLPVASSPECASCGNGAADAGETQDNCCRDLGCPPGPDYICVASANMCYPDNYCGNEICEPGNGETAVSCPQDCP